VKPASVVPASVTRIQGGDCVTRKGVCLVTGVGVAIMDVVTVVRLAHVSDGMAVVHRVVTDFGEVGVSYSVVKVVLQMYAMYLMDLVDRARTGIGGHDAP